MKIISKSKAIVQRKLDGLSPKARLWLVVSVFTAFAVCCVFQVISAVVNFGTGNVEMETRHIESVSLPNDGQGVNNILNDIEEWRKKK